MTGRVLTLAAVAITTGGAPWVTPSAYGKDADVRPLQVTDMSFLPAEKRDFSFAYWLNGWRKAPDDTSPDVLCFESGHYAFALDVGDLRSSRFGLLNDDVDYSQALAAGTRRLGSLAPAELTVELEVGGIVYRAITCKAGRETDLKHLRHARLWESGRLVQHFDLQGLVFEDGAGNPLGCDGVLDIVAWPTSLTLTADLSPSPIYRDGPIPGLSGNGLCVIDRPLDIPHSPETDPEILTVECWVNTPEGLTPDNVGWLVCKNANEWQDGNFGFYIRRDHVSAIMNTGGGRENQHTIKQRARPFRTDAWNHLVLSYDGKTMAFYLNGKQQGTETIGRARVPGDGQLRIGQRADGHGQPVSALFDQIRVWNRVLSPEEIADHAAHPLRLTSREGLTFEDDFDPAGSAAMDPPVWDDARVKVRLRNHDHDWHVGRTFPGRWEHGERQQTTLICAPEGGSGPPKAVSVRVNTADGQAFPVAFDEGRNCLVANVGNLKRTWQGGYTDIRDYDEFVITVENAAGDRLRVPFLLYLVGLANPTGLCPMLCDADGVPTGIPVQLSKNWHYPQIGSYLRAYMPLPATPGTSTYRLRIAYGFYGTLPSASHAQLSLVGYGGNGRWDQLAIGCWGETFCLDMDMSCVDIAITDVRMLMARNGRQGKKWSWTDAGWGGDWLGAEDAAGHKLAFNGLKTAYLAHGPCLTEVRYQGHYGSGREVDLQATVRTLRTDDYARTFLTLDYAFCRDLPADAAWLFKMGRTGALVTPRIAYGNADGLIAEQSVPQGLEPNELFVDRVTLSGRGPWWVAFPGALSIDGRDWGTGARALVIRSYRASFAGRNLTRPTISMPVHKVQKDGRLDLDLLLVPPEGAQSFSPGDRVSADLEWITLPRIADDYYGPNEVFRQHLADNPRSWRTVYREAKGNDLRLTVTGGTVTNTYPIIIQTERSEVSVEIEGGVGIVPIRFEGLTTATGYALLQVTDGKHTKLDQSVHGNDFWQTDFDADTHSYRVSFNLPLDGLETSTWVLRQEGAAP